MIIYTREHLANYKILREYVVKNKHIIEPKLDMTKYREPKKSNTLKCNSFGCIIGHATSIPEFRRYVKFDKYTQNILFNQCSKKAFGIEPKDDNFPRDDLPWRNLFGPNNSNSVDQFITRLDRHIEAVKSQINSRFPNLKNLGILRTYLIANKAIIEPKLNMAYYRHENYTDHDCKSFGCIIGHATAVPEFKEYVVSFSHSRRINFGKFAKDAFNIDSDEVFLDKNLRSDWTMLFGPHNSNSIDDFIERLDEFMIKVEKTKELE